MTRLQVSLWKVALGASLLFPASGISEEIPSATGRWRRVTIDTSLPGNPVVGVDLYWSRIGDDKLKELKEFPHLRSLNLGLNQYLTNAGLRALKDLKNLQTLDLSVTQISDEALKELGEIKTELLSILVCQESRNQAASCNTPFTNVLPWRRKSNCS